MTAVRLLSRSGGRLDANVYLIVFFFCVCVKLSINVCLFLSTRLRLIGESCTTDCLVVVDVKSRSRCRPHCGRRTHFPPSAVKRDILTCFSAFLWGSLWFSDLLWWMTKLVRDNRISETCVQSLYWLPSQWTFNMGKSLTQLNKDDLTFQTLSSLFMVNLVSF